MTLIGLGIRRLSMSAASVGPIKAMVKSLDVAALEDFVATLVGCMDHSLRSRLSQHARDHGVVIESH